MAGKNNQHRHGSPKHAQATGGGGGGGGGKKQKKSAALLQAVASASGQAPTTSSPNTAPPSQGGSGGGGGGQIQANLNYGDKFVARRVFDSTAGKLESKFDKLEAVVVSLQKAQAQAKKKTKSRDDDDTEPKAGWRGSAWVMCARTFSRSAAAS